MEVLYLIIMLLLIVSFFISFTFFIRRILINSTVKASHSSDLGKKMDTLIEQNEQLLSLLREKK